LTHADPSILGGKDETRATEYSKAATRGNWNDVWSNFDQRRKAKDSAANETADDEGPDMFGDAGGGSAGVQAAE
jgi:ribonucleoside-diphosphate reductase beta chain